jgi:glycosyltransferase involved in cell wall biosynthesis
VHPSRTEGLPRAVIEAMARGLPCVGSTVGGIPELLALEDLVPPNDARRLAAKIAEVVTTPGRMESMAARNLAQVRLYCEETLRARRSDFFRALREKTEDWYGRTRRTSTRAMETETSWSRATEIEG